MFCSNCGSKLADGAKFCPVCGAKVDGPSVDPEVKETQSSVDHKTVDHKRKSDAFSENKKAPEKPFNFSSAWKEEEEELERPKKVKPLAFDWSSVTDGPVRKKVPDNIKSPWDSDDEEEDNKKTSSPFTPAEESSNAFDEESGIHNDDSRRTMTFIDIIKQEKKEQEEKARKSAKGFGGDPYSAPERSDNEHHDDVMGYTETILPDNEREKTRGYTDLKKDIIAELQKKDASDYISDTNYKSDFNDQLDYIRDRSRRHEDDVDLFDDEPSVIPEKPDEYDNSSAQAEPAYQAPAAVAVKPAPEVKAEPAPEAKPSAVNAEPAAPHFHPVDEAPQVQEPAETESKPEDDYFGGLLSDEELKEVQIPETEDKAPAAHVEPAAPVQEKTPETDEKPEPAAPVQPAAPEEPEEPKADESAEDDYIDYASLTPSRRTSRRARGAAAEAAAAGAAIASEAAEAETSEADKAEPGDKAAAEEPKSVDDEIAMLKAKLDALISERDEEKSAESNEESDKSAAEEEPEVAETEDLNDLDDLADLDDEFGDGADDIEPVEENESFFDEVTLNDDESDTDEAAEPETEDDITFDDDTFADEDDTFDIDDDSAVVDIDAGDVETEPDSADTDATEASDASADTEGDEYDNEIDRELAKLGFDLDELNADMPEEETEDSKASDIPEETEAEADADMVDALEDLKEASPEDDGNSGYDFDLSDMDEAGDEPEDGTDLENDLFGDAIKDDGEEEPEATKKIEKFYTLYRKNEEFQQLLDEEYKKLKGGEDIDDLDDLTAGDEEFDAYADTAASVAAEADRASEPDYQASDDEILNQIPSADETNGPAPVLEDDEASDADSAAASLQAAHEAAAEPAAKNAPVLDEEDDDDEKMSKGGNILTIIAIIIAVLLVILLVMILVLNFAPNSGIAKSIDGLIGGFANLSDGSDAETLL